MVREDSLKRSERKISGGFAYVKDDDLPRLLKDTRNSLKKVSVSSENKDSHTSSATEAKHSASGHFIDDFNSTDNRKVNQRFKLAKPDIVKFQSTLEDSLAKITPSPKHSIAVSSDFKKKYLNSKSDWLVNDESQKSSKTLQTSPERDGCRKVESFNKVHYQ